MSKTSKLIYWTGPGSKNNGLHTRKEFLRIVQAEYLNWNLDYSQPKTTNKNAKLKRFTINGKVLKKNDIEAWMNVANAKWIIN
jgi:hypothetical protein